jgi:hypothetical protein
MTPSLTRGRVCSLQCSHSLVRLLTPSNYTLPSHLRLCSLYVTSYDSQELRWRYSNPPPHGVACRELIGCHLFSEQPIRTSRKSIINYSETKCCYLVVVSSCRSHAPSEEATILSFCPNLMNVLLLDVAEMWVSSRRGGVQGPPIDFNSVLLLLHHVVFCYVADVSRAYAASIFRL